MAVVTPAQPKRAPAPAELTEVAFDASFVRELPADPVLDNRSAPGEQRLLHARRSDAGRRADACSPGRDDARPSTSASQAGRATRRSRCSAGNRVLPGMQPYAARYGGHQFGHWAGQLGDGRAITLGELVATDGARQELQLKGAGPTPYSRTADGRAVLRSSLREFLCSEAMHHLGVPTTRAL